MADLLRPSQVSMGRRKTITRLTPGGPGRLRLPAANTKDSSEGLDSSRPAHHVKMENSFRMKPQDEEKFQAWRVEGVMREVLEERLKGVTYDPMMCQELTIQLATEIQKRVKDFRWQRYRLVAQVTLGQQSQQGMQVASRCVWDSALDSHASVTYDNKSVFAVAQCYGIYFE